MTGIGDIHLVVLDGTRVRSQEDLHSELALLVDFGPYYGSNLAALWDSLSANVERPLKIIWRDSALSRRAMGEEKFNEIVEIFEEPGSKT